MTEFRQLLEKMDLHEIAQLKVAKQALLYLEGQRRSLQAQMATVTEQIAQIKNGTLDPRKVLPTIRPRLLR